MALTTLQTQRWCYLIFGLSGFTGIIYESVWSHYLKLFLGHAAYAQALVLIIFMGGMALGAWIISRTGHRSENLLILYALIEAIIGVFGLVFHPLYELLYSLSFDTIIPAIGTPHYVYIYKFILASFLILPQSILLGATFPLMSGGFVRKFPNAPGKSISILYFANSAGAAIALLVSTFYLIGTLGLPVTIFSAGILNIIIAILVYQFASKPDIPDTAPAVTAQKTHWPSVFLAASFFTGMASFIYEVVWIRMLSMVLGSSTHSFELMLSAFITGLALGGYWIRRKIDTLQDPIRFAGVIQITMGFFAFFTIFLYSRSFELMSFFMSALDETSQGYILFTIASHSIALLVMMPATICAGMTLPLFTYILLKQGNGEKAIGQIYSSNTIGAIFGVLFAVFIGMPLLMLKGSLLVGAFIDVIIGLVLLQCCNSRLNMKYAGATAALFLVLAGITAFYYEFNIKQMASGVYRYGIAELDDKSDILYHKDGKSASITVSRHDGKVISILTNGKPDASVTMGENLPPSTDEATMTLLAALPLSIYPEARTVANIGMGSGLTTHTALTVPTLERIDTIEIEEAIVSGARFFMPKNKRVFNDPRSYIHIDDARTFFSTHQSRYDIIISEPSNPWVSGVSSLFTREFYNEAATHLTEKGILVQWMHIYELNMDLLVSILKAMSGTFKYYSVYFSDDSNLILLASVDNPIGIPDPSIFTSAEMNSLLSTIYIHNIDDLRFRFLGDQSLFSSYVEMSDSPANSDFHPFLDQNAARARFLADDVIRLLNLRLSSVPILDILYGDKGRRMNDLSPSKYYPSQPADDAYKFYAFFEGNSPYSDHNAISVDNVLSISSLNSLLASAQSCPQEQDVPIWVNSLFHILSKTVVYLNTDQLNQIIAAITPACAPGSLPETISNWLDLLRAFSENNHDSILDATLVLLQAKSRSSLEQARFLYTTLLACLFRIGEQQQISRLWNDYIADLYSDDDEIPLEIQFLLGKPIKGKPQEFTDLKRLK